MTKNNAYDLYYPYELLRFVQIHEEAEWEFQKFDDQIKCLVCSDEEGREIIDNGELKHHIHSDEHKKNSKYMYYETEDGNVYSYLKIYHKFWNSFSLDLQMHQIYFSPLDEDSTSCDLCEVCLSYSEKNIQTHIHGKPHQSRLLEDGTVPWAQTQKSPKIYYPFDLLVDIMGITSENMSLNIQMLGKDYYYCLVCDEDIYGDITQLKDHIESEDHTDEIDKDCRNLYCYHDSWLYDYSDQFQHKQIFFKPCSEDTACCKVCDRELNYQGLDDHYFKSFIHKKELRKWEVYINASKF